MMGGERKPDRERCRQRRGRVRQRAEEEDARADPDET
jgi:hypothetical protein